MLELGSGTGRILVPLARAGVPIVGVDRSEKMQAYARRRLRRVKAHRARHGARRHPRAAVPRRRPSTSSWRRTESCSPCCATRTSTPRSRPSPACSCRAADLGIDLVPDVPNWQEYSRKVALTGRLGRTGPPVSLVESVRQDRARKLTIFDHEYREGWGTRAAGAPLHGDVPDAAREDRGAPARTRRVPCRGGAWQLRRPPLGRPRADVDRAGGEEVKSAVIWPMACGLWHMRQDLPCGPRREGRSEGERRGTPERVPIGHRP